LIDEDGAAGRAFGELLPADFFLHVGDAGMVDAAAELDLDDVERLLRAQQQVDLAGLLAQRFALRNCDEGA